MAEPSASSPVPVRAGNARGALGRLASLALVLELALAVRVLAADAVEWYVRRAGPAGRLCVFPDTDSYWELARAIRAGGPYEIIWWGDIPHVSLRTPGYPLVLAACQTTLGEHTLPVRLVQAVLGTLCVGLVHALTRRVAVAVAVEDPRPAEAALIDPLPGTGLAPGARAGARAPASPRPWTVPGIAAALAAVHPYSILLAPLILSEAVFEPLMLAALVGLAVLWPGRVRATTASPSSALPLVALGTGAAAGSAILVRPSWAMFVPLMLAAWLIASRRDRRAFAAAARGAGLVTLGVVLVMSPWWYRNWQVYGRFVPTALWFGASLYDGLNPRATGASDMAFLDDAEIWPLDEQDQDAELTRRAWAFARAEPLRALTLAARKLARYWSPWPNAEGFHGPVLIVAGALLELPLFALMALGLWNRRRDPRAWVLLAGPVLYFCALHMVFASSMRYRIPGEVPALSLAALGASVVSAASRSARRVAVAGDR